MRRLQLHLVLVPPLVAGLVTAAARPEAATEQPLSGGTAVVGVAQTFRG
jgi:hypothetical protein